MKKVNQIRLALFGFVLATASVCQAEGLMDDLETAATTAIAAGIVMLGVVLLAAFGKDVGLKAYQWVRSALRKA